MSSLHPFRKTSPRLHPGWHLHLSNRSCDPLNRLTKNSQSSVEFPKVYDSLTTFMRSLDITGLVCRKKHGGNLWKPQEFHRIYMEKQWSPEKFPTNQSQVRHISHLKLNAKKNMLKTFKNPRVSHSLPSKDPSVDCPSGSVSPKTRSKSGFSKTLFRKGLGVARRSRSRVAVVGVPRESSARCNDERKIPWEYHNIV